MAFQTSNGRFQSALAEINITPLVDVILVLLIIFMITAPLMMEGIKVDLPAATTEAIKNEKEDIVLTITKKGDLFLQGDKNAYNVVNLSDKLTAVYQNKTKKDIFLRADKSVPYGTVVQVMAACKNAGIERIGMVTEPEAQPQESGGPSS
jgi:biopolymer transport protein TolR